MTTPAALNALQRLGLVPIDRVPIRLGACRHGSACAPDGDDDGLCPAHRSGDVVFDSSRDARVHVTLQVVEMVRAPAVIVPAYLTRSGY